jgi:hypothetical protein
MCFGNLSPIASRTSTSVLPTRSWAAANPAEVGHSLQVPDDDGWFHARRCLAPHKIAIVRQSLADAPSAVIRTLTTRFAITLRVLEVGG